MSQSKKHEDEHYIELGKKLQNFYDSGYVSRKHSLWFSFLKGIVGGAGAFIGGTVVIGILLWILSLFDQIPLLDTVIRSLRDALQS